MASIQNSTWCLVVCGGGGSSTYEVAYISDAAAAAGGVAINEVYRLAAANIYGETTGVLKVRVT